jgi:hypothetical protein
MEAEYSEFAHLADIGQEGKERALGLLRAMSSDVCWFGRTRLKSSDL